MAAPAASSIDAALSRVRIVLVSPSHAGNVGSCARALKTMGLSQLWLVAPRREGVQEDPEAVALSSGATDVLAQARVVPTLVDALAGCSWVVATSSRERELGPPLLDAPFAVAGLIERLREGSGAGSAAVEPGELSHSGVSGGDVALVFGCERTGLSNEDLLRSDVHCMIPANPVYASLNLSQAVQLLCWELRRGLLFAQSDISMVQRGVAVGRGGDVASDSQMSPDAPALVPAVVSPLPDQTVDPPAVERIFEHFLKAMTAVDFLNPDKPKKLVPRLRRLLQRARLEREEVDLLHGFLSDVVRISQGRWYRAEWHSLAQAVQAARQRYGEAGNADGSADPVRPVSGAAGAASCEGKADAVDSVDAAAGAVVKPASSAAPDKPSK